MRKSLFSCRYQRVIGYVAAEAEPVADNGATNPPWSRTGAERNGS